jgi:hypothetical protein
MKLSKNQFEGLTEAQMEWAGNTEWSSQRDRFEDTICWSHKFIYWVENYASVILATEFLKQNRYDYSISYDNAMGQYCFTSNYAGSWVNA